MACLPEPAEPVVWWRRRSRRAISALSRRMHVPLIRYGRARACWRQVRVSLRSKPLDDRQLAVLRRVGDGCRDGPLAVPAHKNRARALAIDVARKRGRSVAMASFSSVADTRESPRDDVVRRTASVVRPDGRCPRRSGRPTRRLSEVRCRPSAVDEAAGRALGRVRRSLVHAVQSDEQVHCQRPHEKQTARTPRSGALMAVARRTPIVGSPGISSQARGEERERTIGGEVGCPLYEV